MKFLIMLLLSLVSLQGKVLVTGKQIAADANKIVGAPYVYGGSSFKKGVDCSAFVKKLYHHYHYTLPRRAAWQLANTRSCPTYSKLKDAEIGDALYFRKRRTGLIHHVGIVSGFTKDGHIIMTHAKGRKFGVVRERLAPRYIREFAGLKKFYNCTSPLAGVFTEKEVGEAILAAAKRLDTSPDNVYRIVDERSGFNPLLISVYGDKADLDKLEGMKKAGVFISRENRRLLRVYPRSIKEAVFLTKNFKEANIACLVGLGQVIPKGDVARIFYPYVNLSTMTTKKQNKKE